MNRRKKRGRSSDTVSPAAAATTKRIRKVGPERVGGRSKVPSRQYKTTFFWSHYPSNIGIPELKPTTTRTTFSIRNLLFMLFATWARLEFSKGGKRRDSLQRIDPTVVKPLGDIGMISGAKQFLKEQGGSRAGVPRSDVAKPDSLHISEVFETSEPFDPGTGTFPEPSVGNESGNVRLLACPHSGVVVNPVALIITLPNKKSEVSYQIIANRAQHVQWLAEVEVSSGSGKSEKNFDLSIMAALGLCPQLVEVMLFSHETRRELKCGLPRDIRAEVDASFVPARGKASARHTFDYPKEWKFLACRCQPVTKPTSAGDATQAEESKAPISADQKEHAVKEAPAAKNAAEEKSSGAGPEAMTDAPSVAPSSATAASEPVAEQPFVTTRLRRKAGRKRTGKAAGFSSPTAGKEVDGHETVVLEGPGGLHGPFHSWAEELRLRDEELRAVKHELMLVRAQCWEMEQKYMDERKQKSLYRQRFEIVAKRMESVTRSILRRRL